MPRWYAARTPAALLAICGAGLSAAVLFVGVGLLLPLGLARLA